MRVIGAKKGVKFAKNLENFGKNLERQGENRANYLKKRGDFGGCTISFAYSSGQGTAFRGQDNRVPGRQGRFAERGREFESFD